MRRVTEASWFAPRQHYYSTWPPAEAADVKVVNVYWRLLVACLVCPSITLPTCQICVFINLPTTYILYCSCEVGAHGPGGTPGSVVLAGVAQSSYTTCFMYPEGPARWISSRDKLSSLPFQPSSFGTLTKTSKAQRMIEFAGSRPL